MTHAAWALQSQTCREGELALDHIHTFVATQGLGGPCRMRNQLNAGATSEATRTCKMIHTIQARIHSNKVSMKGWLSWQNDIQRPCSPEVSRLLSNRWGKTLKKPHLGNLCRRSNPGPLRDRRECHHLLHGMDVENVGGMKFPQGKLKKKFYNCLAQFTPWRHLDSNSGRNRPAQRPNRLYAVKG